MTMRLRDSSIHRTSRIAIVAALLVLGGAGPQSASAAGFFSMQGGVFGPFNGDPGYSLGLQLLGGGASGRARFGAEFQYRNFDANILGVSDVDVDAYALRAVWQQHILPSRSISPYLGLTLGVTLTNVDNNRVNSVLGVDARGESGAGIEGQFLFGVDGKIPNTEFLSIFAEGRIGFGYEFNRLNNRSRVESENIGGIQGITGVRFRF